MDDKRLHLPLMGEPSVMSSTAEPSPDAPLADRIIAVLKTIYDPEIPVDIHELGLIYQLTVDPAGAVLVKMTLTSPACPVAMSLVGEVERKVAAVSGVTQAKVELVWDPPWDKSRMSEAAALHLGLD
jgi:FeS assembly SUF system protein